MDQSRPSKEQSHSVGETQTPIVLPPKSWKARWKSLLLILPPMAMISSFDFGASFVFDLPQSLAIAFDEQLHLDDSKCLLFYSAYSFPTLFVNLIGGWILGKIGYKKALLLYASIVCLGHSLFVVGGFHSAYWVMMVGRAIQGMGAENLMISQYFTSHIFFKKNLLSFAVGTDMIVGLGASVVSFYVMPWLYLRNENLRQTLFLSMAAPFLSLLAVIAFVCLYNSQEKIDRTVELINQNLKSGTDGVEHNTGVTDSDFPPNNEVAKIVDQDSSNMPVSTRLSDQAGIESAAAAPREPFRFAHLKSFPVTFWWLAAMSFICMTTYYQFIGVATKLISIKYQLDYDKAKNVPPVVPLITICLIPLLTRGVYTFGRKPLVIVMGCGIGILAFLCMMLGTDLSPYFVCALVSVYSSCIYSGYWSCAAIASEGIHVNMGLAIINTVENLGSFIMPIVVSTFIESIDESNADSFLWLLVGLLSMSLVFALGLFISDLRSGMRLSIPEKDRPQIH